MSDVPHTPEAFADANGIQLCWDSFGDPAAPKLLLIMGLASQMVAWDDEFCGLLARRGYHVVRFDNRDIGRSTRFADAGVPDVMAGFMAALQGKPVSAPYRLEDMARDAVGLLDALGIERAHVVGASMGGAIAQTMAIHHAERLLSLTSIMATTGEPGLPPPSPEASAVLLRPAPKDQADYFDSYRHAWTVLRAGSFPEDEARDLTRAGINWSRGLNPPGSARQLMAILASGSRKHALQAVRVPTLVIHGDVDPLVPLACGEDTARSVPDAKLVVVPGMGHALPVSMWSQIVDAIAEHAR
jgi:pimeloyl-ACP methyl ester carboxylesterase